MFCEFIVGVVVFFFFKQKTAYEMRISDWSSDVCSSDLLTLIEQKALLVGLSDGLQRRSIRQPEPRGVLRALLRLVFGQRGAPPLADPKLEALRALAMDHVRGRSCPRTTSGCRGLPPELVTAARQLLAQYESTSQLRGHPRCSPPTPSDIH